MAATFLAGKSSPFQHRGSARYSKSCCIHARLTPQASKTTSAHGYEDGPAVNETHINIHIYSFVKVNTLATLRACIHFYQGTAHEQ